MHGVHLLIFDKDDKVINDTYASHYMNKHVIEEMREAKSNVLWYRKSDQFWPKCIQEYFD